MATQPRDGVDDAGAGRGKRSARRLELRRQAGEQGRHLGAQARQFALQPCAEAQVFEQGQPVQRMAGLHEIRQRRVDVDGVGAPARLRPEHGGQRQVAVG
jgi:hypothetical protein